MPKKTKAQIAQDREQRKWEAENDARTLAEAEAIKSDPKRTKRAATAAKRLASDEEKRAKAMRKIADKKK